MAFNANGISDGVRPAQPGGGNYAAPVIIARDLNVRGKYNADVTPGGIPLPLALHHIVPWEHLWTFWNAMVRAEFHDSARDFLSILGVPKAMTATPFKRIRAGTFHDPDDYHVLICWAQWNLVRGPAWRTEPGKPGADPGPNVDDMSKGAREHADRIKSIAELDVVITTYTEKMRNETQLSREIRSWSQLARNDLVEFIPEMWWIETKSSNYVPGGMLPAIHPRWNKAT